ncbi:D-glucuronyl C5-epimerase family protein [Sulfurovum sp. CS9]|uniref:D-glucuronyl C5-epimerase family protein n=1 Tax=Sulfurovum sp. CS9 TaxID=3391146 RepID=UPI0039E9EA03
MNIFSHGKPITILQYFTSKFDDYWHILYPVTDPLKREQDHYLYFYDISRKALDYDGDFSNEGIYLFEGYDGKYHLHPLELAQYSLACWLAWRKTDDNIWVNKAMLHCDWLVENQENDGSWRIEHKNPKYSDLPSPWPSGMAQGLAISSLLRAYRYTGEDKYFKCAKRACDFLEVDVGHGGVKREFDDVFIYEEYPRKQLNGVLNGYISAVLALYELSQTDSDFQDIYLKNIQNLKKILPKFDSGFWTYYALDGVLSSGFYHRYVIIQLKALASIDQEFGVCVGKFEKYLDCTNCIFKALWLKVKKR